MLRNKLKKAASVFLTGSILFSLAGCLDFGGGKKAVLEAAEVLASDMAAADADALIKNSTLSKKSDEAVALAALLDDLLYSEDQSAFFKAVEGTIEYEIDEDSVSVSKGEGSVDIIFTIADYASVLDDVYTDIDELTSAVKKADTEEIKFTAEFVQEDKEWIPDNVGSKKFMKLYGYRSAEFSLTLTGEFIASFIDPTMSGFWLATDNVYVDTGFIEYNFYFDSAVLDYADRGEQLQYAFFKDGSCIYTSEPVTFGESTNIQSRIMVTDVDDCGLLVFDAGSYSVSLSTVSGDHIYSADVSVEVTPESTGVIGGGDGGNGGGDGGTTVSDGEGVYFEFLDMDFKQYVLGADWMDYDSAMIDDNTYTTDVQTIGFSMQVTSDCTRTLNYSYGYTEDESEEGISEALQNPVYTGASVPVEYTNGFFYDFDYEVNGEAQSGYYIFIISDAETGDFILYGFCMVI